jgi:hypothetical protein
MRVGKGVALGFILHIQSPFKNRKGTSWVNKLIYIFLQLREFLMEEATVKCCSALSGLLNYDPKPSPSTSLGKSSMVVHESSCIWDADFVTRELLLFFFFPNSMSTISIGPPSPILPLPSE